ncbi:hypothetical protein [Microcoleus anatoxicus]|uniref:hypothetical protein n=1 Tax=Microcoleus anatoxicus TaxID=2705319 RepID=UPI0030C92736
MAKRPNVRSRAGRAYKRYSALPSFTVEPQSVGWAIFFLKPEANIGIWMRGAP